MKKTTLSVFGAAVVTLAVAGCAAAAPDTGQKVDDAIIPDAGGPVSPKDCWQIAVPEYEFSAAHTPEEERAEYDEWSGPGAGEKDGLLFPCSLTVTEYTDLAAADAWFETFIADGWYESRGGPSEPGIVYRSATKPDWSMTVQYLDSHGHTLQFDQIDNNQYEN